MNLKTRVSLALRIGSNQAIKGDVLAARLGYRTTRAIRLAIREIVREGRPVIGDSQRGYYYPASLEECHHGMADLRSRLIEMALRRRDIKRAAERYFTGQMVMNMKGGKD